MSSNEKVLSENIFIDRLYNLEATFPSIQIKVIEIEKQVSNSGEKADALIEVTWGNKQFLFAVKIGVQFTPRAIESLVERAKGGAMQVDANPMVLTPYLSEKRLRTLEEQQVSGIDLCGNGIIIVPEKMLIIRSGNRNQYPSSSPIRNVYRGTSSIVARSFLLRPKYETSQELQDEITSRGGNVTLSTISKVCSSLADDLIIERKRIGRKTELRLLQPDKLLSRLIDNFKRPDQGRQFVGKREFEESNFEQKLIAWKNKERQQITRTGESSSEYYATMVREPIIRYYCTDLGCIIRSMGDGLCETNRFPDIQITETKDMTVYYDTRNGVSASPIQTYLELMDGDKREQETAAQIRKSLLQELERIEEKK